MFWKLKTLILDDIGTEKLLTPAHSFMFGIRFSSESDSSAWNMVCWGLLKAFAYSYVLLSISQTREKFFQFYLSFLCYLKCLRYKRTENELVMNQIYVAEILLILYYSKMEMSLYFFWNRLSTSQNSMSF